MKIWGWSKTAANNATADPTINWREQQAPTTVNVSARAMMAAIKSYVDDVAGALTTGGANTAYTLATNSSVKDGSNNLQDNPMVAFIPHATNGDNPTLNVDSTGAKPLRGQTGVALPAGNLIQGTPYVAVLNSDKTEWLLHGYRNDPAVVPVGGIIPYVGSTVPSSQWVFPYGQAISRSTYATLWARMGSPDDGDGTTTFNVPDLRGRAVFGQDNMGGSAASRLTSGGSGIDGTAIGAAGGAQNVTIAQANLPNYNLPHTLGLSGDQSGGLTRNFAKTTDGVDSAGVPWVKDVTWSTTTLSLTGSVPSGGSGTALNKMPPAIVLPYILRVI